MSNPSKTLHPVVLSTITAVCFFGCDAAPEDPQGPGMSSASAGKADDNGAFEGAYACIDAVEEGQLELGEDPAAWTEEDAAYFPECNDVELDIDNGEPLTDDKGSDEDKGFGEPFWRVSVKCENVCISFGRSAYQSSTRVGEARTHEAARVAAEVKASAAVRTQASRVCDNDGWTLWCNEVGASFVEL